MSDKENEKNQEESLIDITEILNDYFRIFRRMLAWILLLTIVCSVFFYVRARMQYMPYYTASATFTINIQEDQSGVSTSSTSSFYDNETAEQMAKTFPYILTSGVLRRKVAKDLGVAQISGNIQASVADNTNLFTISVTDIDPERAYDTLQSVIENYPSVSEAIVGKTSMKMLDETGVPQNPDNPRSFKMNAVKGAAAGFALGLCWCALLVVTRRTIRKESDIRKWMNTRCLGAVPEITAKRRSKNTASQKVILTEPKIEEKLQEPMRMLRNKIEYYAREYHKKTFLVTSALAGEGKSTIAVNLAVSLAQSGHKVALIDCDLRHPSDRRILGLEDGIGLSDVLEKNVKASDCLLNASALGFENMELAFIPGGKALKDGSQYLGTPRMQSIIQKMEGWADYVVLDSAPVGLLTDAVVLAQYADAAIFVVRKDFARVDHIMDGMEHLAESKIQIIGGVLNGV